MPGVTGVPAWRRSVAIAAEVPLSDEAAARLEAAARETMAGQVRLLVTGVGRLPTDDGAALAAVAEAARAAGRRLQVVFVLTPSTCYFADDVLQWCTLAGVNDTIFHAAPAFLAADTSPTGGPTREQRFHTALFFDRLARSPGLERRKRFYYRRLAERVDNGVSSRRTRPGPVRPTAGELMRLTPRYLAGRLGKLRARPLTPVTPVTYQPAVAASPRAWRHVLITGWYGTETHGDQAILGELIHFLHVHAPACRLTISSIYPRVSRHTAAELDGAASLQLVDLRQCAKPELIESVDAVIIGGGPLMESAELVRIRDVFAEASRQRKARIIFGCGLGPIHSERVRELAASILELTTAGFVRDAASHEYATRVCPGHSLRLACDPALAFVQRWREQRLPGPGPTAPTTIAGLLRANTREFQPDCDAATLGRLNDDAAAQVAAIVAPLCAARAARFELLSMSNHWLGGDDRLFNRLVERRFQQPSLVDNRREYLPLPALLHRLAGADAAVAMRYHGHLFCMALGIPFLSLDYTGQGGKVSGLVDRIGYQDWREQWAEVAVPRASTKLGALVDERAHWSGYLLDQTARLVAELRQTCIDVFQLPEAVGA